MVQFLKITIQVIHKAKYHKECKQMALETLIWAIYSFQNLFSFILLFDLHQML